MILVQSSMAPSTSHAKLGYWMAQLDKDSSLLAIFIIAWTKLRWLQLQVRAHAVIKMVPGVTGIADIF